MEGELEGLSGGGAQQERARLGADAAALPRRDARDVPLRRLEREVARDRTLPRLRHVNCDKHRTVSCTGRTPSFE